TTFKPVHKYDEDRFSPFFYFVLSHQSRAGHYFFDKPVYLLVNERCYSAAGIFAGAVKGMPNIQIAGVRPDGASGRVESFELDRSDIKIRLSRMLSFQPDGNHFDTFGTEPDIPLERDLDQVLGKSDTQLENLLKIIEEK
ncbi:MAG: S41 family peptidase, partial [Bacteroidota bacterium]